MPDFVPRLALLVALAAIAGCERRAGVAGPAPERPTAAAPLAAKDTVTVGLQVWPRAVRVQGSLVADEETVVGAKVGGRVERVAVDIGSPVRRGDLLAALDTDDLELKVRQAEAQLNQARSKLGLRPTDPDEKLNRLNAPPVAEARALLDEARAKLARADQLRGTNALSAEELQRREAAVRVADAQYHSALNLVDESLAHLEACRVEIEVAREVLAEATVTAPFDGIVQQVHAAPGMYAKVGEPMVTMVRTDPLRFQAGVPETEALRVAVGQSVRIALPGHDKPLVAQISRVSPALDMASRSLLVEADLANAGLRLPVGLFAEAEIVVDPQDQALVVPAAALSEFAGIEKVRVLRGDQEIEQAVQTGRRRRDVVEVLDGLTVGDRVLLPAERGQALGKQRPASEVVPPALPAAQPDEGDRAAKSSLGA